MQASQASKFSAANSNAKSKFNKKRKGAKLDVKRASRSSKFNTKTRKPKSDASSDEFDFEQKEKKHKQELNEVDLMYLINDDNDEDFLGRGAKGTNKGKHQHNLMPLKSPFIQKDEDDLEHNGSSPVDSSRGSSTVMEEHKSGIQDDQLDNTINPERAQIDEDLYNELA